TQTEQLTCRQPHIQQCSICFPNREADARSRHQTTNCGGKIYQKIICFPPKCSSSTRTEVRHPSILETVQVLDTPLNTQRTGIGRISLHNPCFDLDLRYFEIEPINQLFYHPDLGFRIPDDQGIGPLTHLHQPSRAQILPKRHHEFCP